MLVEANWPKILFRTILSCWWRYWSEVTLQCRLVSGNLVRLAGFPFTREHSTLLFVPSLDPPIHVDFHINKKSLPLVRYKKTVQYCTVLCCTTLFKCTLLIISLPNFFYIYLRLFSQNFNFINVNYFKELHLPLKLHSDRKNDNLKFVSKMFRRLQ